MQGRMVPLACSSVLKLLLYLSCSCPCLWIKMTQRA